VIRLLPPMLVGVFISSTDIPLNSLFREAGEGGTDS
jgi:hypothetical protein